jgi:ABC-2 type transport system permease protein
MSASVAGPSMPSIVWQVAEREIRVRLRSTAFLVSTGILLLAVLGSIVIGTIVSNNQQAISVATVGITGLESDGSQGGLKTTEVDTVKEAIQLVRDGKVEAAIVADDKQSTGVRIIANESAPPALIAMFTLTPPVMLLAPQGSDPLLTYLVGLGFGLLFFVSAMTFGSTIAQSVVEEKSTRVIELLLAAIPTRALLAGKILGTSILAFAQIALLVGVASIGLALTGRGELLKGLGTPLAWFVVFFIFGFVLLASMFAATAALVSRQEDIASTTTPVTLLVTLPYFLVIFFNDNPVVLGIMSYVPFSAPVAMPLRIFLQSAEWWEPLLSLAILIATTLGVIALGARIYENALLKLGSRVPWREALSRK